MFRLPRSESVAVVVLGLILVLGSEDSSFATGFQRHGVPEQGLAVKLAFYDGVELDPAVAERMKGEIEAIFAQDGFVIEWVDTEVDLRDMPEG